MKIKFAFCIYLLIFLLANKVLAARGYVATSHINGQKVGLIYYFDKTLQPPEWITNVDETSLKQIVNRLLESGPSYLGWDYCLGYLFYRQGNKIIIDSYRINKKSILIYSGRSEVSFPSAILYDYTNVAQNDILPYNKFLRPAGKQLFFGNPNLENHALDCALSPNGEFLAIEARHRIVIIDIQTSQITGQWERNIKESLLVNANTYSGILWQDKRHILWSSVDGVHRAEINDKGAISSVEILIPFDPSTHAIPNEFALSKSGHYLYLVLNGLNEVIKIDLFNRTKIWSQRVGKAPYGITIANNKVYVTNWAGSEPDPDSPQGPIAGYWLESANIDPDTGAVSAGTLSVLNPRSGALIKEINVGLHPTDIIKSPDEKNIYVANGNSDTISVIDTDKDEVSEEIPVKLIADFGGDSPNGLAISPDGQILYVANGMDNAIAVVKLGKDASFTGEKTKSKILGFIPTGAYPGAVSVSLDGKTLFIANIEAIGAKATLQYGDSPYYQTFYAKPRISTNGNYNAHRMLASISIIPVPDENKLKEYTQTVFDVNLICRTKLARFGLNTGVRPLPVPKEIGEPSLFNHVIYIIKENRTYDQMLGDMPEGNGNPDLCAFGERITPNHHKIARGFLLLDNFYVCGKCSAEGHQWADSAFVTDYIERNVRGWFRSYPAHILNDALAYPKWGFIWNDALNHGKTVRIYGEAIPSNEYQGLYLPVSLKNPAFIAIPDTMKADIFIADLHTWEKQPGDQMPNLIIMALPYDHTVGTISGMPTPRAMVANNDLALGKIVEAISHSRFWQNTAIFVTEDDSQDGWDHVSAYRTVGFVISPYSRLHKTIHTNYNQLSMLRTIEQILGIPPMNQLDAVASPMFNCFTNNPDFTPYTCEPNQIPLTETNPPKKSLKGKSLTYEILSEKVFEYVDKGNIDDDSIKNTILWFATMGSQAYPKEKQN